MKNSGTTVESIPQFRFSMNSGFSRTVCFFSVSLVWFHFCPSAYRKLYIFH